MQSRCSLLHVGFVMWPTASVASLTCHSRLLSLPQWDNKVSIECVLQNLGGSNRSSRDFLPIVFEYYGWIGNHIFPYYKVGEKQYVKRVFTVSVGKKYSDDLYFHREDLSVYSVTQSPVKIAHISKSWMHLIATQTVMLSIRICYQCYTKVGSGWTNTVCFSVVYQHCDQCNLLNRLQDGICTFFVITWYYIICKHEM